jgi:hypothetical protein
MNIRLQCLVFCVTLCCYVADADSKSLVRKFSGSGSTTTAEFEVRDPWLMDWRVTGEFIQQVGIDVSLVNAKTGASEGTVLKVKWAGNGVRLFDQSGRFYFRVNSTMTNWTLKVEQLSQKEAELYKPKHNN